MQNLIGLYQAKNLISKMLELESNSQSILFYGPVGTGKNILAKYYAQCYLCIHKDNLACNTCPSCKSFLNNRAVDFLHITPQSTGSQIILNSITYKKNTIKDKDNLSLQEFLRTPPLQAQQKVVLIEQAERLNNDSANALLKTLEEPHSFAKIILLTSNRSLVLPTILSRCLCIICELPTQTDLEKHFDNLSDIDMLFGEGAPGIITQIHQNQTIYQDLYDFCLSLEKASTSKALKLSEAFRDLIEKFEKKLNISSRMALSEGFRCLAQWSLKRRSQNNGLTQKIVQYHSRISANANSVQLCDSLFTSILT